MGAVFSIFLSQVLGLPEILGSEKLWPLLLGFTGIFGLFQLATLPFCPESPRYLLITKGLKEEAVAALGKLRRSDNCSDEIDAMINEANLEKSLEKFTIFQLFTSRALLVPTVISIMLHLSQQLSGINAVSIFMVEDIYTICI